MIDLPIITFQTAKLAKKKGAGLKWKNGYISDYGIHQEYWYNGNGEKQRVPRQGDWGLSDFLTPEGEYYLAPPQALLQKWLRQEHDIHVWCRHHAGRYKWWIGSKSLDQDESKSYEEALEIGLQRGLKLINSDNKI